MCCIFNGWTSKIRLKVEIIKAEKINKANKISVSWSSKIKHKIPVFAFHIAIKKRMKEWDEKTVILPGSTFNGRTLVVYELLS